MPVNTKQVIFDAFMALSREKSVDKITVKDLVETCHISRQTFYYHFQDIVEVIEWAFQQALEEALSRSLAADSAEEALRSLIACAMEEQELIRKLLASQRRQQVEQLVVRYVRTYLQTMIEEKPPETSLNYSDARVVLDFCTYGIVGLLMEHCASRPVDQEKLARQMARLLTGKMAAGQ
ncbi:TetR/AcrR family transcriptional regulator C-terminal domain-containing protein [Dysosmobacter sp.]|uniref:TetR/AcrR family transcriptional regulator C-terminal domain-containing protein n=1 Tax=Dysosmobacter sp. TaxID=2591382 RepID=UPI002A88016B|nr:TetR/AcrR family transcriptional regulator C-terminal domain-containing protein [Dysosmobacter sp.]MDY3282175.1 TetR/AcrR family transcriptional regulator C-terminal domain-containing protein [Dysosmobacter sp.]